MYIIYNVYLFKLCIYDIIKQSMDKQYSISEAAKLLSVNIQTLRRWDKSGRFTADKKPAGKIERYFYSENDIEEFLSQDWSALLKIGTKWSFNATPIDLPLRFYCPDKSIFKARLSRLEFDLKSNSSFSETFSLIVAMAGEIGNNSFDHNLGNWPDVNGIFFAYNIEAKKVILADRGQGILTTLKQIKPDLADHATALNVAFTEIISGRAPEKRGNGLKFVKEVIVKNNFKLLFQSGNAILNLKKNDKLPRVKTSNNFLRGCWTIISF